MSNMTCYIWFQRVLYADYDYIRHILVRSTYMGLFEREKALSENLSTFNTFYNARVGVNEAALFCRALLGLQSHAFNC